jgi:hypothetical protein
MPTKKPARMRAVRRAPPRARRLRDAAAKTPASQKQFYVRGNRVFFRNRELLFSGDPQCDAPETVLIEALPVEGNRNSLSAREVALLVAEALNKTVAA